MDTSQLHIVSVVCCYEYWLCKHHSVMSVANVYCTYVHMYDVFCTSNVYCTYVHMYDVFCTSNVYCTYVCAHV